MKFIDKYLVVLLNNCTFWECQVNCILKFQKPCKNDCHNKIYEEKHLTSLQHVYHLLFFLPNLNHHNVFLLFVGFRLHRMQLPCNVESFFEFSQQHRSYIWNPYRAKQWKNVPIQVFESQHIYWLKLIQYVLDDNHLSYSPRFLSLLSCVLDLGSARIL